MKHLWKWVVVHLLTVQIEFVEAVWTQVDVEDWMESRMEWAVKTWDEVEPASTVEDAECVTLLGWQADGSTNNSVA